MLKTLLLTMFLTFNVNATIKIAVIDTGLNFEDPINKNLKLCKDGHKVFVKGGMKDVIGHGTNVAHLIAKYAKNSDYCLIIIKAFSKPFNATGSLRAFKYLSTIDVDVVNYSASGSDYSLMEVRALQTLLNKKIKIVVAAGNDGKDLGKNCNVYPACYDKRLIVVGCRDSSYNTCISSNFGGPIDLVNPGNNMQAGGMTLTGTSQSTAVTTGAIVRKLHDYKK